jgi:hypothetical protein
MSVRRRLSDWLINGGTPRWAAAILVKFVIEGGMAFLVGWIAVVSIGLLAPISTLFEVLGANSVIAAWLLLSYIASRWTQDSYIPIEEP